MKPWRVRVAKFGKLLLAGIILLASGSADAALTTASKEDGVPDVKISLDLRDIEIIDALKFLATKVTMNIIPTKKVSGRITLMVDNTDAKDVFDIILRSNNLAYDKRGDIYNVMTEDEYKAIYGRRFSDMRQVKIIRLKYMVPDQALT